MIKENTNYHWNPDEKFEITGLELQLFINGLGMILNTPVSEAQKFFTLQEIHKVSTKILEDGFAAGKVKEGNAPQVTEEIVVPADAVLQSENPLRPV